MAESEIVEDENLSFAVKTGAKIPHIRNVSGKSTGSTQKMGVVAVKKGLKFECPTSYLVVFLRHMSDLDKLPLKTSLVLFASGRGSNAAAIIHYFRERKDVDIVAVVCNNPKAGVLELAEKEQIPVLLVSRESFENECFLSELSAFRPDWIVLAGFLWKIPETIVRHFAGRMVNLHPALLPAYGGKGMYGMRVHEAVIAAGESQSGITIHYVNEHYDEGNIILQAHCSVAASDDAAGLARKIAALEHFYLPRALEYLIQSNNEEPATF